MTLSWSSKYVQVNKLQYEYIVYVIWLRVKRVEKHSVSYPLSSFYDIKSVVDAGVEVAGGEAPRNLEETSISNQGDLRNYTRCRTEGFIYRYLRLSLRLRFCLNLWRQR